MLISVTRLVRPGMSKGWIVDDDLWKLIEPILPPWPARAVRHCLIAPYPTGQDSRASAAGLSTFLHQVRKSVGVGFACAQSAS
jgi:hypothetical protein